MKITDLYKIENALLKNIFSKYMYPYEVLEDLPNLVMELGNILGSEYKKIKDHVWVHESAQIGSGVEIIGPCIIMKGTILRHNAYIRENVIIGENCVIGNSTEIKESILMNNVHVPHFNYVGDSILGDKVHLGAGVILSNLRLDKQNIVIEGMNTNLRKIGAFIGDACEIGCNTVVNPGTIIYPQVMIYPLMMVKGVIKNSHDVHEKRKEFL